MSQCAGPGWGCRLPWAWADVAVEDSSRSSAWVKRVDGTRAPEVLGINKLTWALVTCYGCRLVVQSEGVSFRVQLHFIPYNGSQL